MLKNSNTVKNSNLNTKEFNRILSMEALTAVMDLSYHGIYIINWEGVIIYINSWASEYLKLPVEDALNRHVDEIFPGSMLLQSMKANEIQKNKLTTINNKKLIVTRIPLNRDRETIGAVALFQDVNKLQENEMEIRSKLSDRGLVARYNFDDIIHASPKVDGLIQMAKVYAKTDSAILLNGESGTGKELFAQSIHNSSTRRDAPFVAVNCAALPESILDSELFGYSEASFTGAKKGGKIGLFQQAHKGTIFLDEIGEMSLPVQSKLLRVLQEKQVRPVGSERVIPVDVRVICATHKDLIELVDQGKFRLDLMYRINVLRLFIPPLRERREDIPVLAKSYFRSHYSTLYSRHAAKMLEVLELLSEHRFLGNVRELENILERLALLIEAKILPEEPEEIMNQLIDNRVRVFLDQSGDEVMTALESAEKQKIIDALINANGSRPDAARAMGVSESTLWRKIKKYEINSRKYSKL